MVVVDVFSEILRRPTVGAIVVEMMMFLGPVWIAFFLGIMVGWAWKPRWASLGNCKFDWSAPSTPSAVSLIPSPIKNQTFGSNKDLHHHSLKVKTPLSLGSNAMDKKVDKKPFTLPSIENASCSSSIVKKEENHLLNDEDLKHLWHLVERKDGGPPWKHMMDRSTPSMTYQAWQRDPETGPPQYCSRTVYEDATPELLRDFFWDDDFRVKWDDMILHASTVEELPTTGESIVHWIRKFPFFCSDREYTIGRRIWELGRSYYCVTKGVPCSSIPRQQKPRRVDLYYSSWFIHSVESKKGKNEPACEVIFFHHEDMGIPWEIAKFGVRQGMWGAARKVERGFRLYQNERASSKTISIHVAMAQMSAKIDQNYLISLESDEDEDLAETEVVVASKEKSGINVPKFVIFGGAVILACSLDRGLLTKAVIFGAARRFANIGRRACPPTQL